MSATQQDRLLRFAALIKEELDGSGETVALVARSGLDLSRFGVRYSHAGVSLKASDNAPWSVRQLYYACDEQRPRLYDQGLSGFVFGTDDADIGYVWIVLPAGADAATLEGAALDNARALRLLAATYSANAYPFSLRYQNCNQWVAELLAAAWGALDDAPDLRARAQRWLAQRGYEPPAIDLDSHWLMLAVPFVPLVHLDDHPEAELRALQMRTSLPGAIEAFVHERNPGARRIQMCHNGGQAVIRYGWEPIADGCRPQAGDRVIDLDGASVS
ncbi:MAG TPA: DUF2145 domain-containing protein [Usitatibacter sp.]|nr:DUF2145 domain-containing protein [Usitatibacter sp.]